MVNRKNIDKKYALISVFDKSKLKYLCANLKKFNYEFISSGSTGKKIRKMGFRCKDIRTITKFKEMFGGRIKTLNPLIYSPLLYVRDNKLHTRQFLSLKVPEIDIVIVNFYPFEKYLKKNINDKIVEMIDIGGPSLLRAAAKNYKYITQIINTRDYEKLVKNIKKNNGFTDINFRKTMAHKIYRETSRYDCLIASWFNEDKN